MRLSVPWDIQTFPSLPSTQDFCIEKAEAGASEGLVVQAFEQTAGRGRRGRVWVGGEGNLYVSLLFRPRCAAQDVGQLSILIGVALAEAIGRSDLRLKWPNDVLLDGRKCAGILLDSGLRGQDIEWLVAGIGVNTAQAPEGAAVLGVERDNFLAVMLEKIGIYYDIWKEQGFEPIRLQWLSHSFEPGTALNVGAFADLDSMGNLVVRDGANALKTISAGDVYLKDADYAAGH